MEMFVSVVGLILTYCIPKLFWYHRKCNLINCLRKSCCSYIEEEENRLCFACYDIICTALTCIKDSIIDIGCQINKFCILRERSPKKLHTQATPPLNKDEQVREIGTISEKQFENMCKYYFKRNFNHKQYCTDCSCKKIGRIYFFAVINHSAIDEHVGANDDPILKIIQASLPDAERIFSTDSTIYNHMATYINKNLNNVCLVLLNFPKDDNNNAFKFVKDCIGKKDGLIVYRCRDQEQYVDGNNVNIGGNSQGDNSINQATHRPTAYQEQYVDGNNVNLGGNNQGDNSINQVTQSTTYQKQDVDGRNVHVQESSSVATEEGKACAALLFSHISKQQEAIWLNDVLEIDGLLDEKRKLLSCDTFPEFEPLQEYDDDMKGKFVNIIANVWELVARGIGLSPNKIAQIKQEAGSSKVTKFSYIKNKKIAELLDIDCLWRKLAIEFFPKDSDVESLGRHYAGGGNPALMFLHRLLQISPCLKITSFIGACNTAERNDIKFYFDKLNFDTTKQLRDLDWFELEGLANKIAGNAPGYNHWKEIANSCGFNQDQISSFETSIRSRNSYSPGEKLLQKMRQVKPNMSNLELADYCIKCGLHEVANIILKP